MQQADISPAAVGALASSIAQNYTDTELAFLAALFTQLGDSIALILATRDLQDEDRKTGGT